MHFVKECCRGIQVFLITIIREKIGKKIGKKIGLRFVSAQNLLKTYFTYALNQNIVSYSLFIDSNKLFDTLEEDSGTINLFRSLNLNQGDIKVCSFFLSSESPSVFEKFLMLIGSKTYSGSGIVIGASVDMLCLVRERSK